MKFKSTLLLAFIVITLTQCKKDNNDLTKSIVGKYTSGTGSDYVEIIVTKVDNQTISVYTYDTYNNGRTHAETKMNSETSFTLNKISFNDIGVRFEYEGSGTYSTGNIVVNRIEKVFNSSTNALISDDNRTYTGSK